jgi:hypothetical protein
MVWVLNHVATGLIGLVIVGGSTLASLGALRIVRRRNLVSDDEATSLGGTLEVVGAIYGIVLAFVIVLLWQSIDTAQDAVSDEASSLAQFAVDVRALAPHDQLEVEHSLSTYIDAVLNDEWKAMKDGHESERAHRAFDALFTTMERVQPQSDTEHTWYEQAIAELNDAAGHRRQRLESAHNELPAPVSLLLFGGGIITLAFVVIHGARRTRTHTFVVGALAVLIAYNVFLTVILDHPFSGSLKVDPDPFRQGVLAQVE